MLIYEAGEALRFDEVSIRAGLRGILNIMRHIGMLPKRRNAKELIPVLARTTGWLRAPASGIVNSKAGLGTRVKSGQTLATISDPLGNAQEPVIATFSGIVIGQSNLPLAHEGDALFHIAAFKSVTKAEHLVEEFTEANEPGGQ